MTKWLWHVTMATLRGSMLTVSVFCRTLIDRCHCEWCLYWLILCLVSFPFWNQQQCDCWPHKDSINLTEHIFSGVHVKEIKKKKTFFLNSVCHFLMVWDDDCTNDLIHLQEVSVRRWSGTETVSCHAAPMASILNIWQCVREREKERDNWKRFWPEIFFFSFFFSFDMHERCIDRAEQFMFFQAAINLITSRLIILIIS